MVVVSWRRGSTRRERGGGDEGGRGSDVRTIFLLSFVCDSLVKGNGVVVRILSADKRLAEGNVAWSREAEKR